MYFSIIPSTFYMYNINGQLDSYTFGKPKDNKYKLDIVRYDEDCYTNKILSYKWRDEVKEEISKLWSDVYDVNDVDIYALAMLVREGKINSLFQPLEILMH